MSKSKITALFVSIFLISLIVWIVSEISDKMQKDREYEVTRKKIDRIMDSVVRNTKPREINIQEIQEKIKQEKVYKEDEIIIKDPQNAQAYFDRGVKKLEFRYYKEARADFDKAIELNPKFAEAYYYRSKSNSLSGFGVIGDLNKAISLNPKYTEAYKSRAILRIPSDISGACQDLKMAKKLGDTSCNSMIERFCN